MKKVITYGSFDLFHEGHYRLLQRAKALGDYLIVGVTTEQYDEYRGKLNVVDSVLERVEHVRQTGFADQIIIEDHAGQKIEDIQKYGVDIFTVGSDWIGRFDHIRDYCEVVYLERTKGISSTMLRQQDFGIIRLGIIGANQLVKKFIPEVKYVSGINTEAIYSSDFETAKVLAEENELNLCTDKLDELYDNCNAVYIATEAHTHYEYIKDALDHGKHVLCESPMVLKKAESEELFALAQEKGIVLMEALRTAYAPGFIKLISMVRSGCIGRVLDVSLRTTSLESKEYNESFLEMSSDMLLAIMKILGCRYQRVSFTSLTDSSGKDFYTKVFLQYERAIAEMTAGVGVKSEDSMVITGTNGHIVVDSPWWMAKNVEIFHEDSEQNEKLFARFLGQGYRYEIGAFASKINGQKKYAAAVAPEDSTFLAEIMENIWEQRDGKIEGVIK